MALSGCEAVYGTGESTSHRIFFFFFADSVHLGVMGLELELESLSCGALHNVPLFVLLPWARVLASRELSPADYVVRIATEWGLV
jgi:hypothetical protein